jgi:hypothetical protein
LPPYKTVDLGRHAAGLYRCLLLGVLFSFHASLL